MTHSPPPFSAQDANQLIALFSSGRHAELESRTRELTRLHPEVGFIWKVLGVALLAQNKDGVAALSKAANLMPQDAETWSNLGNAQRAQGLLSQAEESHRHAIALAPTQASHAYNLAIVLTDQHKLPEAAKAYRQAIAANPAFADARFNLGILQQKLQELDAAEDSFKAAVQVEPAHAQAWCNLGALHARRGRLDEAHAALKQAIRLAPDMADAHHNLGNVHKDALRMPQALQAFGEALRLQPSHVDAQQGMGQVLGKLRQYQAAIVALKRAIELDPKHVDAWIDLGNVHKEVGDLEEALACFEHADQFAPDRLDVLSNWLMLSNYASSVPRQRRIERARQYGERMRAKVTDAPVRPHRWDPEKPLRVGLVSGDLRRHPVGYFLDTVLQAIRAQSGNNLALIGYPTQALSDALTHRLKACCTAWHPLVGLDDATAARRICDDDIDILIDLSGHTAHTRLSVFAWRPAPVQVSWLGYFATTGLQEMDHFLSDPWSTPAEVQRDFTERLWLLPETRLCFSPPESAPPVSELPATQQGHVTFGCFNNLTKLNDEVLKLWAAIVQGVAGSRLFLKAPQLDDPQVHDLTVRRLQAMGIGRDRLILEGNSPREEYLRAYHRVDIGLDPFPFTGGTTTAESLWMGVPVLTLQGDCLVARQGVSMMMNVGLADWVANDAQAYRQKAIAFANDLPALSRLRAALREQAAQSPLFDAPRFAQHFQEALRGMWRQRCGEAAKPGP
ncbi:tetratricopeptide repeat protein [Aquabacterium sp. UBA2148]|uniref:tetratricopeptide repeat protein n=1 Tax=Aquabacterium sp. UBA2148 TaxID=1946042 RepID=UPI002579CF89|nr:glycosyltransferase family 41 protein [Aquabacterium sp. UBA2148]